MSTPSPFERELGKAIRSKFGLETKVARFADDEEVNDVFLISGSNCPVDGVTSYGSVGLSRRAQIVGQDNLKVEIVAACTTSTAHVDNLVASCVFDSVKNGSNIAYGACIPNILVQYGISDTLQHVTFVAPFLWQDLHQINVEGEVVYCLMMLPITDAELQYLQRHGISALEGLFTDRQIDIYDINRPSVL